MNRVLIFSVIIISTFRCSFQDNDESKIITILDHNDEVTMMSDIIKGVKYVKLRNSFGKMIGRVDKVLVEDGKIFIFDFFLSKSLFVYDLEGKFKFSISGLGHGPGEFEEVKDFLVTEKSIEILDATNKILIYGMDGDFKSERKLPFDAYKFSKFSENEYIVFTPQAGGKYFKNDQCSLVIYNFKTKNVNCLLKLSDQVPFFTQRNILVDFNNQFYFSTVFNDTIYSVDYHNNLKTEYILDFGEAKFPMNFQYLSPVQVVQSLNDNIDKLYHAPSLFVNDKYLISKYSHNGMRHLILNKKFSKYTVLSHEIENNIDGGLPVYWIHALYNNEIVSVIESNYLIERLNSIESKSTVPKVNDFVSFARTLSANDPHVLIFYQLK